MNSAPTAISDFQYKELYFNAVVPQKGTSVINLSVPLSLVDRRIYFYAEAQLNNTNEPFAIIFEVVLYNGGQIVAKFPAEIGIQAFATYYPRSLMNAFNAGGSPVGDCLVIQPYHGFTTATSLAQILQPLRISNQIDRVTLNINDVYDSTGGGGNLTGYRCFLGCISEQNL